MKNGVCQPQDEEFRQALSTHRNGNLALAITAYKSILSKSPHRIDVLQNLASALSSNNHLAAAYITYQKALELVTDSSTLWSNYANHLFKMKEFKQAKAAHQRAIDLDPSHDGHWYNAGNLPFYTNQPDAAIHCYNRTLDLNTNHLKARWNRGLAYLQKECWQQGFDGYETRLLLHPHICRHLSGNRWHGENLNGKRILITTEQGFGDIIQFSRFLYNLADRFSVTIFLECPKPLETLMRKLPIVEDVIAKGKSLPQYDYHFPLLSLPHQLAIEGRDLNPSHAYIPYSLESDWHILEKIIQIRQKKGFKIGINWRSKSTPYDRTCPLLDLSKIFSINEEFKFYSLQFGKDSDELYQCHLDPFIEDLSPYIKDFNDSASFIKEMDLVISVDSAPAHLAGALQTPTWVLLHQYADWRWHLNRDDSPWYSNTRLFRQQKSGDWSSVITQLCSSLRQCILQ